MMVKDQVLIVDAGNTRIKVALFVAGKIEQVQHYELSEKSTFDTFVSACEFPPLFVSSVLSANQLTSFLDEIPNVILFNADSKLPIKIAYTTPETLGADRLANACAIHYLQEEGNKVAIDLGTCIKFDFVDDQGVYHGGSISPGLQMRFAALHHFTGKLPHVQPIKSKKYLGDSSEESIQAGVIEGIQGELNHFISRYLQDYQGLTFFVTGGDAKFFELPLKNNIFADENLTLTGLYKIYLLNA